MHFQTIARILADNHNVDVTYSDAVDTFYIRQDPQTKRLTVILASRVLKAADGNEAELAMLTRGAFAHEALGHGRHSDFDARAKSPYGRTLHYVLEDIRIERLAPEEYAGAARILREFVLYLEAKMGFWQPAEGCIPEESLAMGLLRWYRTDILGQPLPAAMTDRLLTEAKQWLGPALFGQVDAMARSACFASSELEVAQIADEIVELLKHAKKPQEPEPPQPQPEQSQEGEPSEGKPDDGANQPQDGKDSEPKDGDDTAGKDAPDQPDANPADQRGDGDADQSPPGDDEAEPDQNGGHSADADQGAGNSSAEDASSDSFPEPDADNQTPGNPGDGEGDQSGDGQVNDGAGESDIDDDANPGDPAQAERGDASDGDPSSGGQANEGDAQPGDAGKGSEPRSDPAAQDGVTEADASQMGVGNPTQPSQANGAPPDRTPASGSLTPTSAPQPDGDEELDFSDRVSFDVDYHNAIRDALKDLTIEVPALRMSSSDIRDAVEAVRAEPLAAEVRGVVQKMKAGLDNALRAITDDEDDIEADMGRLDMSRIARIASGVEKQAFLTDGAPGAGLSTELLVFFDESSSMDSLGAPFLRSLVYATGQALATYAPDVRFNLAFFGNESRLVHTADHHWTAAHGAKVAAMYVPDGGTYWAQSALPLVPLLVKSRKERKVFLTVSDGDINAFRYPEVLQEMKENHIEASFVCIGEAVPEGLKGVSCETNAMAFAKAFAASILSAIAPQFA